MTIERFADLLDWTRQTHRQLSHCLGGSGAEHPETRAQWLLVYIADHENALAETVARIECQADPKALNSWVGEYLERQPLLREQPCDKPYATMAVGDIAREIFAVHTQLIELYRSLARRAELDGASVLATQLLELEQQTSERMALQVGRLNEM